MSERPIGSSGDNQRQQSILAQAEGRYGPGAQFVYARRQQRDFVAMTLAEAMTICGEFIVDENPELLWSTLDKWHAMAGDMQQRSPQRLEQARVLGKSVLNERSRA